MMNYVEANGIELAYEAYGDETGEPMLLISGLGTQMIRWTSTFCESLADRGFRVMRFDNRDAGCSTHLVDVAVPDLSELVTAAMSGKKLDVPYSLRDMAEDAVGLLDALKVRAAHVVGRSMGGMIAQILASEHRQRVLSLTSIMSSNGNPQLPQTPPDVMSMMMRPGPDPDQDWEGFAAHSLQFAQRIAGSGFAVDEQAHRALILEEHRRGRGGRGAARHIAAIAATGNLREQLASIDVPTLVIHGADDPLVPPACGRDTAEAIPGAKFMMIDGMGHEIPPALENRIAAAIHDNAKSRRTRSPAN
jgi:pimeloyl-ACP methyl ester carboxylesterase